MADDIPEKDMRDAQLERVVHCRDCRKQGLLECPLVFIEKHQLVFIDHDPDWFCADGEEA